MHIPTAITDLAERVGSTGIETVLGSMTASAVISNQPWSVILGTAATAMVYALGKGLLAMWAPTTGSTPAGLVDVGAKQTG